VSGEVITREGRVVSGNHPGVAVEVTLRVGDQTLGHRGLAAELELILDDGSPVTVVTEARTRTKDLRERSETGPWRKLSGLAHAELVRDHAPGPHVRASLVERFVEPGTRVIVRGPVVAGTGTAPQKIRAVELSRSTAHEQVAARERKRTRADVRDWIGRGIGGLLVLASLAWAIRWVALWPAELVHPGVDKLRLAVGVASSTSAGLWLSLLLRRRGARIRMLPRFVGGDGQPIGHGGMFELPLVISMLMTLFWGVLGAGVALNTIAEAGDVWARNAKGHAPAADGFVFNATVLFAAVAAVTLLAWEWGGARLAKLLRPLGPDWQLAQGRLTGGSLVFSSQTHGSGRATSTHWSANLEGPLTVEAPEGRWTIDPEGLVWAVDLGPEPEHPGNRSTIWRTKPGAAVVVAGRLSGPRLRASGPESLILVASELDDDLVGSIRRGLWTRRLIVALPVIGALVSAAVVYL
jgi:hypothetical protein